MADPRDTGRHLSSCSVHNMPAYPAGPCDCGLDGLALPFSYMTTARPGEHDGAGHVYIIDANGKKIASLWGPGAHKLQLASLIIKASERDDTTEKPIAALRELHALVRSECPSLLREDSGGDAALDLEIRRLLNGDE